MKKKLSIATLLLIVITYSCTKECECSHEMDRIPLFEAQVGEKWYFTLLKGKNYRTGDANDFEYTGDTLVVEVMEAKDGEYVLKESISAGSNIFKSQDNYIWNKDSSFLNRWYIENGSLVIKALQYAAPINSHLMTQQFLNDPPWGRGLYEYPISLTDTLEVDIKGWKTTLPYQEIDVRAFDPVIELFDKKYINVNVFINNGAMATDANGSTTVYSEKDGIIRTSYYSVWDNNGIGWDRIP